MRFKDTTYADAVTLGYDCIQVKYGGEHVRVEVSRGHARLYPFARETISCGAFELDDGPVCTLIGNWFSDSKRLIVWDCWTIGDQPTDHVRLDIIGVGHFAYRNRLALAKQRLATFGNVVGATVSLIESYPIDWAPDLWSTLPERNRDLKVTGIVFRKSQAPVGQAILVARWYPEHPSGLP